MIRKSWQAKMKQVAQEEVKKSDPQAMQVQKFEEVEDKDRAPNPPQQSQQNCEILIRMDAHQKGQHKKQSNSQSYQRFHLRRLNELDP